MSPTASRPLGDAHESRDCPAALSGMVVLDLGQVYNGPYCGMLLRELGASVVKIEPFSGEPIRWRVDGKDGNQAYQLLNAGKQSLRLDLKKAEGHKVFLKLVATADVVIENFAPGVMERLGLGYEVLKGVNPKIVVASGKGYGSTGPNRHLRGMDITVQAMSGIVATTGFPEGPPVKAGPAVVDFSAGVHLAAAVLAALVQRGRTGLGQHVEVSMQDAIIPSLASNIAGVLETGDEFPDRTGNRHGGLNIVPYNIYPTKDGWLAILGVRDRHWRSVCKLMGNDVLSGQADLDTAAGRVKRMDEVDDAISSWTRQNSTAELFESLQEADVPCAPVQSLREVMQDPHVRERGVLRTIDTPQGPCLTFGSPLRLSKSTATPAGPPPSLGEHSKQVLRDLLSLAEEEIEQLAVDGVI